MTLARAATPLKFLSGVVLGAVLVAMLVVEPATPSKAAGNYKFKPKERCFMRKINNVRHRRGLRRLERDKQLGYVGRRHAKSMAGSNSIWHDASLGSKVTRWKRIGDNVGVGGGCKRVFKAFMRSSPHRSNILGRWRYVGAGTERRNGKIFVDTIFESRRNPNNTYNYP